MIALGGALLRFGEERGLLRSVRRPRVVVLAVREGGDGDGDDDDDDDGGPRSVRPARTSAAAPLATIAPRLIVAIVATPAARPMKPRTMASGLRRIEIARPMRMNASTPRILPRWLPFRGGANVGKSGGAPLAASAGTT